MPIKKPLLCRKLLGRWAPVLAGGVCLATVLPAEGALRVPATLDIRRAGTPRQVEVRRGFSPAPVAPQDAQAAWLLAPAGRASGLTSPGGHTPQLRARDCELVPSSRQARAMNPSGERRTMENRYGTFDAHLDEGEELSLALEQPGGERAESSLCVSASMDGRSELPLDGPASLVLDTLSIGRITFLGDYLWVQRDADGVLMDVWMSVTDDEEGEKK